MALSKNFWRRHFPKSWGVVSEIIIAGIIALSLMLKGFAALRPPPSLMKLLKSEKAANEVIAQLMLLSITIIGIGTVTLYGIPAISSLEDMANARNGEQSLTVIDSHANLAILGNSPSQMSNINLGGGTLTVEPNSSNSPSYMTVTSNNFSLTIPMGKIEYTLADRTVAYEGGGMWTKYPSGKSIMLSPPALHYNGVMLSLPVTNISGNDSVGGKGTATVSFTKNQNVVKFPNPSPGVTQYNQTVQIPQTFTKKWDFSGVTSNGLVGGCSANCTYTQSIAGIENWTVSITYIGSWYTSTTNGNPAPSIEAMVGAQASGTITWQSPNFTWNNSYGTLLSANLSFDRQVPNYDSSKNSKDCLSTCSFSVVLVKPDGNTSVIYPNTPFSSLLGWTTLSNATVLPSDFMINGNYSLELIATLSEDSGGSGLYFWWDNPSITLNYTVPGNVTVNVTDTNMTNPVNLTQAGNVYVNITSDYYDAWAGYAESLGYANVSTNSSTHTVSLNLSTVPNNFGEDTSITNPIVFRGLDPSNITPLDSFSFMLVPFGGKLDWDIRTKTGKQKLIFSVTGTNPVSLNVGYQNGNGNTAETWNYTGNFPVQNGYFYIDMLNTSLNLAYSNITVSANNSNSCQPFGGVINQYGQNFNSTGYAWGTTQQTTTPQTFTNKSDFNSGQQGWIPTGTGGAGYPGPGNGTGNGIEAMVGNGQSGYSNWTSPSFYWSNGTPNSVSLYVDWSVTSFQNGCPSACSFSVVLNKPGGTSQLYYGTFTTGPTTWAPLSNVSVSPSDFSATGYYNLSLITTLSASSGNNANNVYFAWDNPNITINYNAIVTNSLTNKSLHDITEHYFSKMNQGGELSFGDCGPYQPAASSTMRMNYTPTGGLAYLQISDNRVNARIN